MDSSRGDLFAELPLEEGSAVAAGQEDKGYPEQRRQVHQETCFENKTIQFWPCYSSIVESL